MKKRIWIWWNNAPVRITLTEGIACRIHRSARTDEGYEYESHEYLLQGEEILMDVAEGGRDCDGRHDYYSTRTASADRPAGLDEDGWPTLPWRSLDAWQRDHTAEAMGY